MIKYFIKKGTYIDDQKKIDVSKYDKIGEFKDGVAPVCSNEAFKYIDESGNEIHKKVEATIKIQVVK